MKNIFSYKFPEVLLKLEFTGIDNISNLMKDFLKEIKNGLILCCFFAGKKNFRC